MEGGEDWLLRPALRGVCRYESLKDGTLSLQDVALMNEALDIDAENNYRVQRAQELKMPRAR